MPPQPIAPLGPTVSPNGAPSALQQLLGPSRSAPVRQHECGRTHGVRPPLWLASFQFVFVLASVASSVHGRALLCPQILAKSKDISLKFNPPPRPAPGLWPKPRHGRRAPKPSTAALRDDPGSYSLEVELAPAALLSWTHFELVVTDVSEQGRPSARWHGLSADMATGLVLFPQPDSRATAADRFWPLSLLPWLQSDAPASQVCWHRSAPVACGCSFTSATPCRPPAIATSQLPVVGLIGDRG